MDSVISPSVKAPPPKTIYLDWTDYCNAKCFFCDRELYEQRIGGKGEFVPFEKLKKLEKTLSIIEYFGISSAIGEPLLHPELHEILGWLYEINPNIRLRAVTNGTTLTAAKASWFAGHLDWLSVSLNASNAEAHLRDMFPHLVKSGVDATKRWDLHIRRLTEFVGALPAGDRPRVRLQAVAHRYNLDDMVEFVRLAARMGVSHVVIPNIAVHEQTVDYSLYWVKDHYNDVIDEAAAVGAQLGVRVDAARFYTSIKPILDLDKVCRDPIDIAYISRESVGAPCCQWAEPRLPIDAYSDEGGFERYWNDDVLTRLRKKRDFASCRVCGLARVFDETSFHFSPSLKKNIMEAKRIADVDSDNDYPDAELVRTCVDNRLDLPTVRRTLLRVGLPVERVRSIEIEGLAALPALDSACWEAFQAADEPPAASVAIALAAPFAGNGWGTAGYEPDSRKSWRALSHAGVASVFVRVVPGFDYEVRFVFHEVGTLAAGALGLTACGQSLKTRLLADDAGRVLLAADIPAAAIAPYGGRLWLTVGYAPDQRRQSSGNRVSFSQVEVTRIEGGILDIRTRRRIEATVGQFRVWKRLAQLRSERRWSQAKAYAAVIKADPIGSIPRIRRRIERALGLSRR
jgi:MoaA/NifB/PqqE/SkfB family radical SAM enzyme